MVFKLWRQHVTKDDIIYCISSRPSNLVVLDPGIVVACVTRRIKRCLTFRRCGGDILFLTFTEQRVLPLVNVEEEFVADAEDSVEHKIERCSDIQEMYISSWQMFYSTNVCVHYRRLISTKSLIRCFSLKLTYINLKFYSH